MNRDEILSMEPGRELDALVAKKIFGVNNPDARWSPSTEISAAWEVEAKMLEKDIEWKYTDNVKKILLQAHPEGVSEFTMMHAPEDVRCKAALLAVMGL